MTYDEVVSDRHFRALYQIRVQRDKEQRLLALEELGILTRDDEGKWRYSDAFLAWLFEES
jgi:hypothetical protein